MYARSRSRSPVRREKKRSRSRSPRRHRSRSPKRRERDREKDRERDRERDRDRDRERDRERDRDRYGSNDLKRHRSPRGNRSDIARASNVPEKGIARNCEDENAMMEMMGFTSFDSTKGKHVDGQVEGTVRIQKPKKYRQYMNRRGGFNRPLDYVT